MPSAHDIGKSITFLCMQGIYPYMNITYEKNHGQLPKL